MRSLIGLLLVVWTSGVLSAFAQDSTRSGFAIVTLVSGNIAGVVATERLKNTTDSGIEQVIVPPAPLVMSASLLVPGGSAAENKTGITLTNPSLSAGGVNLVLTNQLGAALSSAIVRLGPRGQFSQFLNELFGAEPPESSTPLLLTINSEIPVGILALSFQGSDFVPIPMTSLSPVTPVAVQPVPTSSTTFSRPGFGTGVPTVTVPAPIFPIPVVNRQPAATTTSIGGGASLLLAQVTSGGGWSTEIAIGNTSTATQVIRIDFFASNGVHTGSITDISIASRGVFFFSTELAVSVVP